MPARKIPPVKNTRLRHAVRVVAIVIAVLLVFPVLHVGMTRFVNPTWSPMQGQRALEARFEGEEYAEAPVRWTDLAQIPVPLIHYIWASEDQNFFKHGGFDFDQLQQSIEAAKKSGGPVRGSSTITMQCARSVYLWQGRSYVRKALEAYYTFWMELLLSKQRILELYLNHIEFGPGIYGVGAAAEEHFDKAPSALSKSEMMSLAAILPNPLNWDPANPNDEVRRKIRRVRRLSDNAPFPKDKLK